jgi:uncharacterized protein (TIGR00369 family)
MAPMFTVRNPEFATRVRQIFDDAPFIQHLGVEVVGIAPGLVETALVPRAEHLQQDGVVHAGVVATLADHTAGAAAGTLMAASQIVLTSELGLHLLRPARGRLACRATVLKPGRTLSVVEAEVTDPDGVLVAKLIATLAIVDR